ncbi:butyrate kinase [Anaeromyxobacter dehalogenans 2CP-1]|uniref:Probable butyrate kinase n=1 Tax=Anaeromyxobacter dehalogenans (strain ATCC BAA-258 / DSM 21875 / 2CP-1) TaxID=455488 RepID=B8J7S6_ANAD2|nr:butyrate kinase [Anaeromyxobacter dehalogenans]ACL63418.1 butyrate kinase [Anaeromyxobacter dehalogenans 2CP-1]
MSAGAGPPGSGAGAGGGPLVLAVNPGAGSTKLGLFRGGLPLREEKVLHPEAMARPAARIWDELPGRVAAAEDFLSRAGVRAGELAAVAGRGGLLPPLAAGAYLVDDALVAELERAAHGEHASNLGAPMARALAAPHGCPALVVDPVSVDELAPVARVTGLAGVERSSFVHALNLRAVARRHAAGAGRPLEALRLVLAHLGTGISLCALSGGRMVDVVNPRDEGPFSGDRAGGVPANALVDLCFAPGADVRTVRRRLFGDGGLYAHLGTRDVREALARAERGDARAALLVDAMCYQAAKAVAAMAVALDGRVDAIVLTGGLAHLAPVVEGVRRRVAWIAPVEIHPGEDELRALAEGALRVLAGEEPARRYAPLAPAR